MFSLFDGLTAAIIPAGDYLMAEATSGDCQFRAVVTNSQYDSDFAGESFIDLVTFTYDGDVYVVSQDGVSLNGNDIASFPDNSGSAQVIATSKVYKITTQCGVNLVWDPENLNTKVRLSLPPALGGGVSGLCGNCNGEDDDMEIVSSYPQSERLIQYGIEYKIEPESFK